MANDSMGYRTRSEHNLIPTKKQRRSISLMLLIAIEDRPYLSKWVKESTWKFLNEGQKK